MFGKKEDKPRYDSSRSPIILTTAHDFPSREYRVLDMVMASDKYLFPAQWEKSKVDLQAVAANAGADAVIAVQIVTDHLISGSGGRSLICGTAIKFVG